MAAGFQNALVADIEDAVAALDGGQALSHDEAGAALQQRFDALLQKALRLGVDGRSGLVQNENARVGEKRPGKGDQLPLALTETAAALVDRRSVLLGHLGR